MRSRALFSELIKHRNESNARLDGIQSELQNALQNEQAILYHLPRTDAAIATLQDCCHASAEGSERLESSLRLLQDHVLPLTPAVQDLRNIVLTFGDIGRSILAQRTAMFRQYQEKALKKELADFRRLFESSKIERRTLQSELHRMNAHLEHLSRAPAVNLRHETTEMSCFFFTYKDEQRASGPSSVHHRNMQREVTRLTLSIPSWFVKDQWIVSVAVATRGWQYSLRLYRVLPNEAKIFDSCLPGDVDAVKRQLANRQVSIYDQNENGHTLLHVCSSLQAARSVVDKSIGCGFRSPA